MNEIRNASNQLIAYVRGTSVYSGSGTYLGYISPQGTFDASGRKVANQQIPSLLV